jgi:serine/threonine protein kinase
LIKSLAAEEKTMECTVNDKIELDKFNILKMIGKGSFGEVFLVEEKNSKKVYAMKVLTKEKVQRKIIV